MVSEEKLKWENEFSIVLQMQKEKWKIDFYGCK